MNDLQNIRLFAIMVALKAGRLLREGRRRRHLITPKDLTDFKTETDDKSDHLIRRMIAQKFPNHTIISEESDIKRTKSGYKWVVDPLDGTVPYTRGSSNHWAVSIGVVRDKTPVVGVIYAPSRNELYIAQSGWGAVCNNRRISVSSCENINEALVVADRGKKNRTQIVPFIRKMQTKNGVTSVLCFAASSVSFALAAAGKIDAVVTMGLDCWDMAAAVIIIREAGGKATTLGGRDWQLGDDTLLVANPALHKKLLDFFSRSCPR